MTERYDVRIAFETLTHPTCQTQGRLVRARPQRGVLPGSPVCLENGRVGPCGVRELLDDRMNEGSHGWSHRKAAPRYKRAGREESTDAHPMLGELTDTPCRVWTIPFWSPHDQACGCIRLMPPGGTCAYTSDGGRRPARRLAARPEPPSMAHDLDTAWINRVSDTKRH